MSNEFELAEVRRKKISELVQEHGAMGVQELCDLFGMSGATIRRDLKALDKNGFVMRTHGGVMKKGNVMADLPNEERKSLNADEKRRIGTAAIERLVGDEVVFLDAGTTALAAANEAHRRPDCTYVTTSLGVANALHARNMRNFYLIGGSYQKVNDSFTGTLAISALRSLSFDIAYLCCSAIDVARRSISLGNEAYSLVQREVVAVSRKKMVIADHSKLQAKAFVHTAGFDEIDGIITSEGADKGTVSELRDLGMELVVV